MTSPVDFQRAAAFPGHTVADEAQRAGRLGAGGVEPQVPHGTEVEILLYQENPVTDYYLVKIVGGDDPGGEGWIPEPLLSIEPVE